MQSQEKKNWFSSELAAAVLCHTTNSQFTRVELRAPGELVFFDHHDQEYHIHLSNLPDVTPQEILRMLNMAQPPQVKPVLSRDKLLDYEIRSSWWACFIFWGWGQELSSSYFAWKIKRKYRRYKASIDIHNELKGKQPEK